MKRIEFIAMLFILGFCALLVGGMNFYEISEFYFNGQAAEMELSASQKKLTIPSANNDVHLANVRYVSSIGTLEVPQKRIWGDAARKVMNGERVVVTYLKHNPQRVLYQHEELDSPWAWLAVGLVAMGTFFYSLKLRRRESEA